jgi:hypothetical protein
MIALVNKVKYMIVQSDKRINTAAADVNRYKRNNDTGLIALESTIPIICCIVNCLLRKSKTLSSHPITYPGMRNTIGKMAVASKEPAISCSV